jgi:phytoene/squalene synthetase
MRNAAAVRPAPSSLPPLSQSPAILAGKTRQKESFPVAWLVGARQRDPLLAYYTFARTADDLADHPTLSAPEKLTALTALRAGLADDGGGPSEAIALRATFAQAGLSTTLVDPLLDAFCFDAKGPVRIADPDALLSYCEQSALPVGRFLLALYGEPARPDLLCACDALCIALQGLNHLQGLGEDWRDRNRCYLPQSWLNEAGCSYDALDAPTCSPALRKAIDQMRAWCGNLIAQARPLPHLIANRRLAAQAAATLSTALSLQQVLAKADPLQGEPNLKAHHWARAALASLSPLLSPRRRSRP